VIGSIVSLKAGAKHRPISPIKARAAKPIRWYDRSIRRSDAKPPARHTARQLRKFTELNDLDRISRQTGDACIKHFTDNCPIYNTLRRGGPISIERK
jgi:hypothetical protein